MKNDVAIRPGLTVFVCAAVFVLCTTPARSQQALQVLRNHVRTAVASGQAVPVGFLPPDQHMNLAITLPLRNEPELASLLDRLYDPTSQGYRRFLSVDQFTEAFGPTRQDYQAVVDFAKANGFTVTDTPRNRLLVDISGTVAQVDKAFHVVMMVYQHPTENRTFYSPDREPSLNLNVPVAHIAGLNNFSLPHPGARRGRRKKRMQTSGSGPGGSFLGSDMRAAYYGGSSLNGSGQAVGLLEYSGYSLSDVQLYFRNAGQVLNVPINNVALDGVNPGEWTNTNWEAEVVLDIDQAISMAPGMAQIRVYVGTSDADILNKMASENLAKQLSCSWYWYPDDPTDNPIFQEFAAQGQSLLVISGDLGAYTGSASTDESYPGEDIYVTTVGGTHLTTNGAGGSWQSETAWSYSGGGPSDDGFPIPAWQAPVINSSNGGSYTKRNAPDVAAEGDYDNYICFDNGACQENWGGTSFATPRWAGFMALANQQAAANGTSPIGFLNPTIYFIGQGEFYNNDFHDITIGNNNNGKGQSYNAVTGYDLVTGWGSPNGQSLINDLSLGSVVLSSLSISPSTIVGGLTAQGNVYLTGPAPPNAKIALSSNNTHFVQVPRYVEATPGYTSVTFPVTTFFTSGIVGATIAASYNNTTYLASLTVLPVAVSGVTFYPSTVTGGNPAPFTVYLDGPAAAGTSLTLVSSNTSVLYVSSPVNLSAGGNQVLLTGTTYPVVSQTDVTLTASYNGSSGQATLTVVPQSYSISGQVTLNGIGLSGVGIALTGAQSGSATTNSSGNYSFGGLPGGLNYTVTPSLSGYTFSPPSQTFVSLNSDQTANFVAAAVTYALTVTESGSGSGTVTSSPPGIYCGSVCTASFTVGTLVTLTAAPANGSVFAGWGGACNGTGTCSLTMNSNQSVTATFNPQSRPPVPQINVPVVPVAAPPGSPGFTLTVNGSGFVPQSTVNWNGSPRPTAFGSSSQLTATISATDVSTPATALITVSNAGVGSLSNSAYFSVTDATSSISLGKSDLSVASQPESVVTGDFNRDGIPDLAVASFSGAVSVMIGNGDGTFRGHVDYPTGAGARGIVIGDFNGDGKLDLAVANQTSNTVSILLGNGDGTFQGHVDYPAGTGPFSLATGDFNGDGTLDLAVVNQSANQVSILLGVGDGTFQFSASYATGQLPFGIVVGDFNLDGHLDLAVANYTDSTVSILLGNGDGTFKAHTDYVTGASPEMLATADLNSDGKLDLAVGTNQATASQISILLGNGNGTFAPHSDFPAGSKPRSILTADLNGDGKIDLAVANYGGNTVSLLLGNGDGTFSSHIDYPTGASPQFVTAGDFAGNGRLDLAVANYGSNTASVLLQIPTVTLSPTSLNFGAQQVGTTSAPQNVTLTNSGSAPLNVSGISVQGDFAQSNTCNTTVQAGSNCEISVTFTPTVSGTRSGMLTIADNAANSPQTVSLSGTGGGTIGTTTTLSSSLNPSSYGQAVTLTAVVVPSQSGTPTGSVTFYDGTTSLGTVTLSGGAAALTTSTLTAGNHSLTAAYSGDGTFGASTSPVLTQTVLQAGVSITLTSSPNPSYVNQLVTFSVVVSGNGATPTGSVTFKAGTNVLGTVPLVNGQASFTTTFTKSETVSISASYSGDQNYKAQSSNALKQVVKQYTTSTALASSLNPSTYGQAVTFTATINSSGPTPTGTVTFKNGSKSLGSASLSGGVAKITTSTLPAGTLSITASYGGDAANAKSTSPALKQVVDTATSTTTIVSSVNPSKVGQTVKFTATVASPTTIPTGTVIFMDGSTELGTGTLAKGKANYSTSTLKAGSHNITAVYEGTANIDGSTSMVLVQTVN